VTSKVYVSIRVPADPARAFEAFTEEIALWWQPNGLFAITPKGDGRLAFEGGAGGRLFTTLDDGQEFEIGKISAWEPGRRLAFSWRQSSFDADQLTEVEVLFERVGAETRVSIEHRAWDTIPEKHVARHGFPETATLGRVGDWWRTSLAALRDRLAAS
jgi:uncharacterized protein YndB with AHSA1/START domain